MGWFSDARASSLIRFSNQLNKYGSVYIRHRKNNSVFRPRCIGTDFAPSHVYAKTLRTNHDDRIGGVLYACLNWPYPLYSIQLGCCGVNDYTDFEGASHWQRDRWVQVGDNYSFVRLSTPFSCCRPYLANYSCATAPTDGNSFYKTVSLIDFRAIVHSSSQMFRLKRPPLT